MYLAPNGVKCHVESHLPPRNSLFQNHRDISEASYLDFLLTRDQKNNISERLYEKHDAIGFQIVNFPFTAFPLLNAAAFI